MSIAEDSGDIKSICSIRDSTLALEVGMDTSLISNLSVDVASTKEPMIDLGSESSGGSRLGDDSHTSVVSIKGRFCGFEKSEAVTSATFGELCHSIRCLKYEMKKLKMRFKSNRIGSHVLQLRNFQ